MQLVDGMECGVHPDDICPVMQIIVCSIQLRLQYSHSWICSIQSLHAEDVTSFMYICVVASYIAKLNDVLYYTIFYFVLAKCYALLFLCFQSLKGAAISLLVSTCTAYSRIIGFFPKHLCIVLGIS